LNVKGALIFFVLLQMSSFQTYSFLRMTETVFTVLTGALIKIVFPSAGIGNQLGPPGIPRHTTWAFDDQLVVDRDAIEFPERFLR
jgi:hypothetical protein